MKYSIVLCALAIILTTTTHANKRVLMPSCDRCETAVLPGDTCKCGAVKDKTNDDDREENRILSQDYYIVDDKKHMLRGN